MQRPYKVLVMVIHKNVVRHSWIIGCGTGLKASVGVESCSIRIVTVGICCIRKLVRTITIETAMAKSNHRSDRHCRSIFFFRKQLFRSLKKISRASWRKSLLPAEYKPSLLVTIFSRRSFCGKGIMYTTYAGKLRNPVSPRYLCVKNNDLLS